MENKLASATEAAAPPNQERTNPTESKCPVAHVLLLFEPGHYPLAYFPESDVAPGTLQRTEHTTRHSELGVTAWYTVRAGEQFAQRGAWLCSTPHYSCATKGSLGVCG